MINSTLIPKFKDALIQFIVGALLLWLAWRYLSYHPAELQSIRSSISAAQQKIQNVVGRFTKNSGALFVQKQQEQALSQLEEIITAIQSCDPTAPIQSYQELYRTIQNASLEEMARDGSLYYNQLASAYTTMRQLCSAIVQSE